MSSGRSNEHPPDYAHTLPALDVVPVDNGGAAITGPVRDLAALLDHLSATGAVVTASGTGVRGRIRVTLPAHPLQPSRWPAHRSRTRRSTVRRSLLALAALSAAAAVAAVGWGVYLAVMWISANVAAIAGVGIALAVLAILARPGACTTTVRITHRH